MSKWKTLCTAMLALAVANPALSATVEGELGVGDKAPRLDAVAWLQGEPVTEWQEGQVYVLDFWATWCGPCKATIPHINELGRKYADQGVNVIGVAIWPRDGMVPTADYVAEQGDGMAYRIAEDVDGRTAEAFMRAALCNGIPTVMVVDRTGTFAWIGHPMSLDEPLAQIVAGNADREAFIAADKKRRNAARKDGEVQARLSKINAGLKQAYAAQDWPAALAAIDEMIALDGKDPSFPRLKYSLLLKSGDAAGASSYGATLVSGSLKESPQGLNELAWYIVDPEGELEPRQRDLALAMAAAVRADELTKHKDANILDTLARVHFHKGDVDKAVELQKQAVELATVEQRALLQPSLDEYLRASEQG
jgi:thiol-disulfide isomerase/thioredoxin